MIMAKDPKKYGFDEEFEDRLDYDSVTVSDPVDLRLVAECTGSTLEEVKMLNPELNRLTTPRGQSYSLRIPKNTKQMFLAEIATVPPEKRITWRKHEVKPGETLNTIAALYRTSANSIAAANSFDTSGTLQVGQKLVIPIGHATPEVTYAKVSYSSSKRSTSMLLAKAKKVVYRVKRGDTLFQIANLFKTDVNSLKKWNGIGAGEVIAPGDRLTIYRK
jgi:membrane-bound lytic murein transglycosylase D